MKWPVRLLCLILLLTCSKMIFAVDGRFLRIDDGACATNTVALVMAVAALTDESLPGYIPTYPFQDELFGGSNRNNRVRVDLKLVVQNRSMYEFEFPRLNEAFGYDCIEFDLQSRSGLQWVLKRRPVGCLSARPLSNVIKPGRQFETLISLDPHLWMIEGSAPSVEPIEKFRPRFAYGVYKVDDKRYRTMEDVNLRLTRQNSLGDRYGELRGDWLKWQFDYRIKQYENSDNDQRKLLLNAKRFGEIEEKCK